jgi:membrane associated rhomboid family serine protease
MYFPIRTEGYRAKPPPGILAILLLCLAVQLLAWHNKSKYAAATELLKYGPAPECASGKASLKVLQTAEDFGILQRAGMKIERPTVVTDRLEAMRRASLVYKAGLVADDPNPANFLTSLFIHAGWIHFAITIWFLYLAGATLERHWGTGFFLGAFFACGLIGGFAYLIVSGHAERAAGFALVGPAGALAGIMAAFAATHWDGHAILRDSSLGAGNGARIPVPVFFFLWIACELLAEFLLPGLGAGIALPAPIAGALTGFALARIFPASRFSAKEKGPPQGGPFITYPT